MDTFLSIDKSSNIPVYKQLADGIESAVACGIFKPSEKLPSERELSSNLGVSRGTIKKAFDILSQNGLLTVNHGSGTFVKSHSKNTRAQLNDAEKTERLIDELRESSCTFPEVKALLLNAYEKKRLGKKSVKVAVVDCNSETLDIIRYQLTSMNIHYSGFLLEEVTGFKKPSTVFSYFDFILTTTTHYNELSSLIPEISKKIIKAVLSPDVNTIIGLKAIPKGTAVAVVTRSRRFSDIIEYNADKLNCGLAYNTVVLPEPNAAVLKNLLRTNSYMIVPPGFTLMLDNITNLELADFYKRGGNMVVFNYTIEKGSLIYIEEKAKDI